MSKTYNTADNLEDLDIAEELSSFDGVFYVLENYQITEDEHKDADYYIDAEASAIPEIEELLSDIGASAYIEDQDGVVHKVGFYEEVEEREESRVEKIIRLLDPLTWRGEMLIGWAWPHDLKELTEVMGESFFSEGGFYCNLQYGGVIGMDLIPFCDHTGIDPEELLKKDCS